MRIYFSIFALLSTTGATMAQQPYEGSWAPSKAACEQEASDGNFSIRGSRFEAYESSCKINNVTRSGGAWTLRMSCSGEGEEWKEATHLSMLTKDQIARKETSNGPARLYVRCLGTSSQAANSALQEIGTVRVVGVAANDVLNIREFPTSEARIVGVIPPRSTGVSFLGKTKGSWVFIRHQDVEGWVSSRFVTPE